MASEGGGKGQEDVTAKPVTASANGVSRTFQKRGRGLRRGKGEGGIFFNLKKINLLSN